MADDEIDLIWLNQNEADGEAPANDNFAFLWEDGEAMAWEDGQPILTETGEQLLTEAA
ncbi:MAG: hypothetical protein PHS57_08655 [Alphaproteobacteria bacterium]|nr:hypothetical protein [Alphaproteobacteria bacterium]